MQTEQKKKAVIYCRVSTKEQVEEGNSLSTQEKICKDYALKNGYEIAEVFIEQGESAKTAQRTELQKLMAYCSVRKNGVSVVIAYKIDRISRNTDDYSQIRLLLKRYGVEIKSTSEFFENTPAGRFMENIIANVAQFDNDVRTERSVGGMKEAMREGRYIWMAPIGYDNVKVGSKCNIAFNCMAPLMCKAFTEVAKDCTAIDEVRRRLVAEGLKTKSGKPVAKNYFYKLLRNELYTGWINRFGERHKGTFEPLVSEEVFAQVQRVINHRRQRVYEYKWENPDFPLRRFIAHPLGGRLTGCWCKGRTKHYAYYRFQRQKLDFKKCVLEDAFVQLLNSYELSEEHLSTLHKKAKEWFIRKSDLQVRERTRAERVTVEMTEKRKQLIDKNLKGVINDSILQEQLGIIEQTLSEVYPALQEQKPLSKEAFEGLYQRLCDYLSNPGQAWQEAPFSVKLRLQWFNFPKGVLFDGQKFQTTETCRLFKLKARILDPKSTKVHLPIRLTNQAVKEPLYSKRDASRYGKGPDLDSYDAPDFNQVIDDGFELINIFDSKPSCTDGQDNAVSEFGHFSKQR